MSAVLLKILIATLAFAVGVFAFVTQAIVMGRVRAPGAADPARLRKLHRLAGDVFAVLLLPLIYLGLDFLTDMGDGIPHRGVLHFYVAETMIVLVLFKVLFSRAWRGFLKYAPTVGFAIAALLFITWLNTAGYSFLRMAVGEPIPGEAGPGAAAEPQRGDPAGRPRAGGEDEAMAEAAVSRGAGLFKANCALCHSTEHAQAGPPPGLKGLLKGESLPSSDRAATAENVRSQLRDPIGRMPSFARLSEAQVDDLIAYLRTL